MHVGLTFGRIYGADFLAHLDTGGQVICPAGGLTWDGVNLHGDEDAIAQILKFC